MLNLSVLQNVSFEGEDLNGAGQTMREQRFCCFARTRVYDCLKRGEGVVHLFASAGCGYIPVTSISRIAHYVLIFDREATNSNASGTADRGALTRNVQK